MEDIEAIYKELASHDRLYVPAQAVREFAKNRTTKLGEAYTQLQRISGSVVTLPGVPMLAGIPEYEELRKLVDEIKPLLKRYHENLATLKARLADWGWEDRVSQLYREVFTVDKIAEHEIDEADLKADLTRRITFKIPPGYKDASKDDEGVGDLLIWHAILALAGSKGRHIIFVSNEVKPDWMVKASGDARCRVRN